MKNEKIDFFVLKLIQKIVKMQTLIEELLDYEYTPFSIHTSIRVIDPHLNTKNWIPKITIETNTNFGLLIKKTLINEKHHGPFVEWWNNGHLLVESNYVNGELHGPFKKWYENGRKWEEYEYVNGKFHGPYKSWYNNGKRGRECEYLLGKRHGSYKSWHRNGRQGEDCEYVNGERHSFTDNLNV
jgi:antitoxin component YwqK of YwqJK toxin-antitoxin module